MMMKKLILFLFCAALFPAQKTEKIKLNKNIKSEMSTYRGFMVLDKRDSQEIGSVSSNGQPATMMFENDAAKDIKDWFY